MVLPILMRRAVRIGGGLGPGSRRGGLRGARKRRFVLSLEAEEEEEEDWEGKRAGRRRKSGSKGVARWRVGDWMVWVGIWFSLGGCGGGDGWMSQLRGADLGGEMLVNSKKPASGQTR